MHAYMFTIWRMSSTATYVAEFLPRHVDRLWLVQPQVYMHIHPKSLNLGTSESSTGMVVVYDGSKIVHVYLDEFLCMSYMVKHVV